METETLDLVPPENLSPEAQAVWLRGMEDAAETRAEREAKNAQLEAELTGRAPTPRHHEADAPSRNVPTIPGLKLAGLAYKWHNLARDADGKLAVHPRGSLDIDGDVAILAGGHRGPLVASTADGSAKLWQDDRGLQFECSIPDTPEGQALLRAVRRGLGCSIGCTCRASDRHLVEIGGVVVEAIVVGTLTHIAVVPRSQAQCKSSSVRVARTSMAIPG